MNRSDGPVNFQANSGGRPRARTMVRIDLENAYARLGVSPLMPTDDIKEIINRRRKDVMRLRRTRSEQRFGDEEAEMTRLQTIEDEIGTPKARTRYDRLNPQNALLTIQPSPADAGLEARNRAGLVTAWLVEELGRDAALPSPESLATWAPRGLSPDLLAFLASFAEADDPATAFRGADEADLPDVAHLGRLGIADGPTSGPGSGSATDG